MPGGSCCTRTTSPTPSIVSMSSMMTVNLRFTFVPIGSGCLLFTNTPVREMFVTYSWMKASNDSNSLLIVTRSSLRLSSLTLVSRPRQIELLEVIVLARLYHDLPREPGLRLLHSGPFLALQHVADRRV